LDIARELSCPPHLTSVSTLPCKTYRTSFVQCITYFFIRLWTFGIKCSLTVETPVFNVNSCFRRVYWYTLYILCQWCL